MTDAPTVRVIDERNWMKRKQVLRYLNDRGIAVSLRTLEQWAANNNQGKGPPFTVAGSRIVRYHRDDVDDWITRKVRRVT